MANDLWRTPPEVFQVLNKEFEFIADMASSETNNLCNTFFTEEDDSLSFKWAKWAYENVTLGNAYVWCNPPYSDPMPWVLKALEAQKDGLGVVMLLNDDKSVGWFFEALKGVSEIRCIISDGILEGKTRHSSGRIGFLDGNGDPQGGNNKPQFILVFNPYKIGANITSYVKKSDVYGL